MDRRELMDLLRLHTDEVRAQVATNWDRAKSSLTFHVALLALVGGFRDKLAHPLAITLFLFTGISAVFCAGMIGISHGYYRAARDRRAQVEELLGLPVRFGTTRTQRGDRQVGLARWWPKVNTILISLHVLIALMAFGAALAYSWSA